MKQKRTLAISPVIILSCLFLLTFNVVTYFYSKPLFIIELVITVGVLSYCAWYLLHMRTSASRYLARIAKLLSQGEQNSLSNFPMPVMVVSAAGEIIWYNDLFHREVVQENDLFGEKVEAVMACTMDELRNKSCMDLCVGSRQYLTYISTVAVEDTTLYLLYYVDNTELKEIAAEYTASRPSVMVVYIDNLEELMQDIRDSERAQVSGRVETLLEDWIGGTTGVLRKYGTDRFLVLLEERHLIQMIDNKFSILDEVRALPIGERAGVTLSIGVGQGETLRESEQMARQAIDMALGRGGDQAAVKTKSGFDFYGGVSKGVERRTKVRTRVVASAMMELINGCDNVLVMGHRYSDLDCLGAAVVLASVARESGKPAYVVLERKETLAVELLEKYENAGKGDIFIDPEEAMPLMNRRTLLLITDTHNPHLLECPALYHAATTVVVIDHHRKMVDHIENAVIFYHEPYSSSASEMVAELVQYMKNTGITRLEAEALLAGIMLDTRSFVMKAGVRTFEAAAYLRGKGADTVEVKRMFSGSMDLYRRKSEIVAGAELYRRTAIACDGQQGSVETRIAAAQAADELLCIKGVEASFTLFADGDNVNISARSLGDFNVQLVMENLDGGGHQTMAGALLKGVDIPEAKQRLMNVIADYLADRTAAKAESVQGKE